MIGAFVDQLKAQVYSLVRADASFLDLGGMAVSGTKLRVRKDLEILLLRRQLEIVDRECDKPLRVSRGKN